MSFFFLLKIRTTTKSDELLQVRNMLENEKNLRQSSQDEIIDLRNQVQHWKKSEVRNQLSLFHFMQ
jgi:hypothetical protein